MDNSLIQDMKDFCGRFKLSSMDGDSSPIGLKEVVDFQSGGLRGKTTEEIESFIFKTHAYNMVLKNKKSSMKAFVTGMNSRINRFVSENLGTVDKFLPYNAKRDAIISTDESVSLMENKLVGARMQLDKIGDLPDGIDQTLRSLESYLRRRHQNG